MPPLATGFLLLQNAAACCSLMASCCSSDSRNPPQHDRLRIRPQRAYETRQQEHPKDSNRAIYGHDTSGVQSTALTPQDQTGDSKAAPQLNRLLPTALRPNSSPLQQDASTAGIRADSVLSSAITHGNSDNLTPQPLHLTAL